MIFSIVCAAETGLHVTTFTLNPGLRVRLPCEGAKGKASTVSWRRNGERVNYGERIYARKRALVIEDASKEDFGNYTCFRDNGDEDEEVFQAFQLIIEDFPNDEPVAAPRIDNPSGIRCLNNVLDKTNVELSRSAFFYQPKGVGSTGNRG